MNPFLFHSIAFLSSASIFTASAFHTCDFCPEPATLDSDDSYCNELLRLARLGHLYDDEEECDFNIPILAKRCKCSAPALARHEPCDPCVPSPITAYNTGYDSPTTISNPQGSVTFFENQYSCIEMLYSARNGGLHPSQCEALSSSEVFSTCGGCIETKVCDFDKAMCRTNQVLVASNPQNYPGASNLWSTALTCQDVIKNARNGSLLSDTGCNTFKSSIEVAFQPGSVGLGLFDLSTCGLQCDYDKTKIRDERKPISGVNLVGRSRSDGYDISLVPSDGPSLLPSDGPSLKPSDGPSLLPSDRPSLSGTQKVNRKYSTGGASNDDFSTSVMPSDFPSIQTEMPSSQELPSEIPSDLPSLIETDMIPKKLLQKVAPGTELENCLLCDFENDSAFYLYRDFGETGTTFFEALSAPEHRADCKEHDRTCAKKEPLYPDLENCFLADVGSYDDLIGIQAVIPPKKAAYISVYKDTIVQLEDGRSCNQSFQTNECVVENYKQNLDYGYGKIKNKENATQINMDSSDNADQKICPRLKMGWYNYGSDIPIPSNIWKDGQPSYCYSGPIQNAAAVWPVQPNGSNYGDMRDVSAGWKLTGAVYKCCKSLYRCTVSTSAD